MQSEYTFLIWVPLGTRGLSGWVPPFLGAAGFFPPIFCVPCFGSALRGFNRCVAMADCTSTLQRAAFCWRAWSLRDWPAKDVRTVWLLPTCDAYNANHIRFLTHTE